MISYHILLLLIFSKKNFVITDLIIVVISFSFYMSIEIWNFVEWNLIWIKRYRILQVRIEETTNLLVKNFKTSELSITNNLLMKSIIL